MGFTLQVLAHGLAKTIMVGQKVVVLERLDNKIELLRPLTPMVTNIRWGAVSIRQFESLPFKIVDRQRLSRTVKPYEEANSKALNALLDKLRGAKNKGNPWVQRHYQEAQKALDMKSQR